MKKVYLTPNARIITLHEESALLTGSISGTGDGDKSEGLGGGSTDETWGGEFDSNRREGFFGGGMWDNM